MVTLRRDVAAAVSNKIFDKKHRDAQELTAYDLFMEKKKQQRYLCDYKPVVSDRSIEPECRADDGVKIKEKFHKIFGKAPKEQKTVDQKEESVVYHTDNIDNEYKSYLLEQLNRTEPGELMDKETFYQKRYSKTAPAFAGAAIAAAPAKREARRLSKNGKIFVAVYVLVVALVASIILAVNSVTAPPRADASSGSEDAQGVISPMDIPSDGTQGSNNGFDKLLDGLSNG